MDHPVVSLVVPAYNEAANVAAFVAAVTPVLDGLGEPWEIVFVDDGSRDDTLGLLLAARALLEPVVAALPRIQAGGRLVYAGAGTSGRLGVLDSVELYPTFSWPRDRAVAVIAGGEGAMFVAVEGAEDDRAFSPYCWRTRAASATPPLPSEERTRRVARGHFASRHSCR